MDKAQREGIDSKGRDDILVKAMNKPERGGHVVAIGSGITKKEYFGYNKPTPPHQLHTKIDYLSSALEAMKNYQNLLTSFVMSSLTEDQVNQLMNLNDSNQLNAFNIGLNTQIGEPEQTSSQQQNSTSVHCGSASTVNASFTELLGLKGVGNGVKFSLVSSKPQVKEKFQEEVQEVEPYIVSWPTAQDEQHVHTQQPNLHMLDSSRAYSFPEGENECSLALQGLTGEIQVVAIGTVYISPGGTSVLNHHSSVQNGFRRVGIRNEIDETALLPCPTEEWTFVCQAKGSFVQWPSHLIFPLHMIDEQQKQRHTPSTQSSHATSTKQYVITSEDRSKLTSYMVKCFKNEALTMKRRNETIHVDIPLNVLQIVREVDLNYEDLLDWCFQKEISAVHLLVFMKILSEECQRDGISGMYGFCDVDYLSPLTPTKPEDKSDYLAKVFSCNEGRNNNQLFFAPYYENRHWMLAIISPWNGIVFWLDPVGNECEIREFAQKTIDEGIIKFSLKYRKNIKKVNQNKPNIRWMKPKCPRQQLGTFDCGFFICRYMFETIQKRSQVIPDQYFSGVHETYSQEMIDQIREMWIIHVLKYREDVDDEDDAMEVV